MTCQYHFNGPKQRGYAGNPGFSITVMGDVVLFFVE
jgi:hypothetical protein